MEKPLISVVIPVWNEEERILRAIHSMQNQTYSNLEIIVVDDGSTDGTAQIVEELAKKDPRVTFHRNPNKVQRTNWRGYDINAGYAARNYGFSIAKGEWITTQDADDASLRNRIEVQHSLATRYHAKMVTVSWQHLTPDLLEKSLDVERIFTEQGEKQVMIPPQELARLARHHQGILMRELFHRFIPFPIKWFPYTRKLFYRSTEPFPGADNCMFLHRSVFADGIFMRPRNERTWGIPSGRGSGRDFAFRVAARYPNECYSFKLPLYLWNANIENKEFAGFERYLTQ